MPLQLRRMGCPSWTQDVDPFARLLGGTAQICAGQARSRNPAVCRTMLRVLLVELAWLCLLVSSQIAGGVELPGKKLQDGEGWPGGCC